MSFNKPIISSITANYNNSKYIIECLDSLRNQTMFINNIIVADDASTDNSWDVLNQYMESMRLLEKFSLLKRTDNYIKFSQGSNSFTFIKKSKNEGPAASRNVCLKECLGSTDVVCVCDSDDIYYSEKVEKSVEILANNDKKISLVYSDYDVLNMSTGIIGREFKEIFSYNRLYEECIVSNNSIMNASLFDQIGLYDETLFGPEDYDLWLRIAEKFPVYHIPESLYVYRITGNNITVATNKNRLIEHLRIVHEKKNKRLGYDK